MDAVSIRQNHDLHQGVAPAPGVEWGQNEIHV